PHGNQPALGFRARARRGPLTIPTLESTKQEHRRHPSPQPLPPMPYAGRPMGLLQSRADFVACALEQLVLAARGVAGWPLEGDSQKSDGGGAGSGNCELRQCYALAYLAAALLPLPHAAVPAV